MRIGHEMLANSNTLPELPRVLVAEDNKLNSLLIAEQLRILAFVPDVVGSGREALLRWRSGAFAVVLTDLNMPDMDGYALAKAVRAEEESGKRIPIIALTADAFLGASDEWRRAGMDAYLPKPIERPLLKAALDGWVRDAGGVAGRQSPGSDADAGEALDPGALARIVGDDPAVLSEFMAKFGRAADKAMARIDAAMSTGNRAEVSSLAHQLKASAAAVGAIRLSRLCERIETTALENDPQALIGLWPLLGTEMGCVKQWISARQSGDRETAARSAAP